MRDGRDLLQFFVDEALVKTPEWKLASVIRGEDGDGLLDTYESERSPHVREFIETAVKLGAVIQSKPEVAGATNDGVPPCFETSSHLSRDSGLAPTAAMISRLRAASRGSRACRTSVCSMTPSAIDTRSCSVPRHSLRIRSSKR
ncbi:hypothetical protein BN2476_680195 [Paraburkholderia piptadeniae]|uniref:FAD-binding domain-containing protein n=1 Tax=Paraburkholderia piptadeniae TaxID=1701573 RepID=A0A1N7SQB8_9BURK|nr:FAD-dependent monooxygenase [Paraburkholderia piptadeniae]SIT49522.1 hypothetical protein BN2476_680195 [Paraburkholderia piptadeniae]